MGHETRLDLDDGCWGGSAFVDGGRESCYTLVCDPLGSGTCTGLVPHDELCVDPFASDPGCPRRANCVAPALFPPHNFVDQSRCAPGDPDCAEATAYYPAGCEVSGCWGPEGCVPAGRRDPFNSCLACDPSESSVGYFYRGDGASCAVNPDVTGACAIDASGDPPACVVGDTCASAIDVTSEPSAVRTFEVDTCALADELATGCASARSRDAVFTARAEALPAVYQLSVPTGWTLGELGGVADPCGPTASRCGAQSTVLLDPEDQQRFFWSVERTDGGCGNVTVTVLRGD